MNYFLSRSLLILSLHLLPVHMAQAAELLHPVSGTPVAKDFTLLDLNGISHKLSSYRGKIVIVNFWATWCPPVPSRDPVYAAGLGKSSKSMMSWMLAIHVGGSEDKIWSFLTDFDIEFSRPSGYESKSLTQLCR